METKKFADQWLSNSDSAGVRAQLRSVLDQISAGVMIIEAPTGNALHTNDRMREIWRNPEIHTEGQFRRDTYRGFWPSGAQIKPEEWQSYRSMHQGISIRDEEVEIIRGDQTRGFVSISSDPILDEQGKVQAVVLTVHDITELRRQ